MDLPTVIRLARQSAGLSQRALAGLAGVSPGLVAGAEAGRSAVSIEVLDRLLEACALDLELVPRGAALADEAEVDALSTHLLLSTTQRLYLALGGTAHWSSGPYPAIFETLARSQGRALSDELALGIWLPDRSFRGTLVDATVPRQASHHVGVRVGFWSWTWVAPPLTLAAAYQGDERRLLYVAAAMLAMTDARDEGERRPPPHRTPDESNEAVHMARSLTYAMLRSRQLPDGRDSRGWRLQQPVSLRQRLVAEGLPPRRGSQRDLRG